MSNPLQPGTLYVVGTPIGNLEDMTFRAVATLNAADVIAAEDTRHTGKLLQHFQIATPQIAYHHHNRSQRIPEILDRLQRGEAIALVTDAGMPGISDPGYELVKACAEAGLPVVPIPGVSASVTAVSVSGIECDRFTFEGFLPTKGKSRRERLEQLSGEVRTLIFYEAPHRLRETLADLASVLGNGRSIALGRELTKRFEEIWRGTLGEAIALYQQREPKGEYTIVVAGASAEGMVLSEEALKAELQQLMASGLSRSQASRELARSSQLSRRQLYQLALTIED
ncbi:16S rRNA (cytidine(1402)-2'-O)-methyltransferase [Baaleninema sp.]|uniref:16S rRNA (cytidine(1402)-2'-O)-methyltransferase n=1 Tax=Baaleninema sp. TaxID=3101197 RepID=UPI003D01D6E0